MRIFKDTPNFNILGRRKLAYVVSLALILVGVVAWGVKGITYGIDFKGGTLIQVKFQQGPDLGAIRELFSNKFDTSVQVTSFGEASSNEVMITLSQEANEKYGKDINHLVDETLAAKFKDFSIRRVETVGSKVGGELKSKALWAAIYSLAGILLYVGIRFQPRYGVAAVVALFHDVMITLGVFILLEKEFTLTIVAALLTIIGYSLNDTIVVFDRVRENVARMPRKPLEDVINLSVNESLSRTILTSLTTFVVVFCMYVFGGDIIRDFCFAMLIGLVVGTYSSVFVASPVVIWLNPKTKKA